MPLSTDVRLPRDHLPRFPDLCCVCGRPRPGDILAVARRRSSRLDWLMPWLLLARQPVRCEVPACATCRDQAIRHRRLQSIVLVVTMLVALLAVKPLVDTWGLARGSRRSVTTALVLVLVAPVVIWLVLRPRPVDLTVEGTMVVYQFRNADYARAFEAANGMDGGDAAETRGP